MVGAIAANLHEGSRSEYLAQYVFASFGTAMAVPHQEDSGIDLYYTLTERVGQRAWPRAGIRRGLTGRRLNGRTRTMTAFG